MFVIFIMIDTDRHLSVPLMFGNIFGKFSFTQSLFTNLKVLV